MDKAGNEGVFLVWILRIARKTSCKMHEISPYDISCAYAIRLPDRFPKPGRLLQ